MDNSTVMYIAVFAAIVAVIALIMIWQVRSSLNPQHRHQLLKRQQLQQQEQQLLQQLTMVQS